MSSCGTFLRFSRCSSLLFYRKHTRCLLVSHGTQVPTFRGAQAHTVFIVVECLHAHTGLPPDLSIKRCTKTQTNSYLSELHHHFCALSSHRLYRRNQNQWITHMNHFSTAVCQSTDDPHIFMRECEIILHDHVSQCFQLFVSSDLIYR